MRRCLILLLEVLVVSGCGVLTERPATIECGRLDPRVCEAAVAVTLRHRPADRLPVVAVAADFACPEGARGGCGQLMIPGEPPVETFNVVLIYENGTGDLLAFGGPVDRPWTDGWLHIGKVPGHLAELLGIEERGGTGVILPVSFAGQPVGTPVVLPADELEF